MGAARDSSDRITLIRSYFCSIDWDKIVKNLSNYLSFNWILSSILSTKQSYQSNFSINHRRGNYLNKQMTYVVK